VGKVPFDVDALGVDLLSLSAHKMYGPKGAGALYVRASGPRVRLCPLFDGGGHERGLRSGTLDVPGIVGLGEACDLAARELGEEAQRLSALRERLREAICAGLDEVSLNGPATGSRDRLPGNLNLSFAHVDGNALLIGLRNLAVSSGSACTSADPEPSHVLRALGVSDERTRASLRFGLGRFTTAEEVDYAAGEVVRVVRRLRDESPLHDLARHGG
jgi:cysteine desulfurase